MPSNQAYGDDVMVSGAQAARVAQVHPNTMYRWIHSGAVPSYRSPGGQLQVRVGDVRPERLQRPAGGHPGPDAADQTARDEPVSA